LGPQSPSAAVPDDELMILTYGDPTNLDPALNYETAGGAVLMQIYDTLVGLKRESTTEFVPMLAYSYTISPDNKTYTFRIREGVKFHNGNALTPSDVAYTFQRGLLQGGSSSPQWLLTEPILGMGVMDVCDLLDPSVCDNRAALLAYQLAHTGEVWQVCNDLQSKIVADDAAGTVTFQLEQAWGPFLKGRLGWQLRRLAQLLFCQQRQLAAEEYHQWDRTIQASSLGQRRDRLQPQQQLLEQNTLMGRRPLWHLVVFDRHTQECRKRQRTHSKTAQWGSRPDRDRHKLCPRPG